MLTRAAPRGADAGADAAGRRAPAFSTPHRRGTSAQGSAWRRWWLRRSPPPLQHLEQADDAAGLDVDDPHRRPPAALGRPGMVRISPSSGYRYPGAGGGRMSRMGTRKPRGTALQVPGRADNERCVLAIHSRQLVEALVGEELDLWPRPRAGSRSTDASAGPVDLLPSRDWFSIFSLMEASSGYRNLKSPPRSAALQTDFGSLAPAGAALGVHLDRDGVPRRPHRWPSCARSRPRCRGFEVEAVDGDHHRDAEELSCSRSGWRGFSQPFAKASSFSPLSSSGLAGRPPCIFRARMVQVMTTSWARTRRSGR